MHLNKTLVAGAIFCLGTTAALADPAMESFTITGGKGSFSGLVAANTSFIDVRNFTLPSYAVGTKGTTFSFYSADPDFGALGDINFSSISLSGGSLLSSVAFKSATTGTGMSEMWSLNLPQQVAPGSYSITLVGRNVSSFDASYGGTVSVTAVPEPSGVVAALAGFGVFAALISRRREDKTEA